MSVATEAEAAAIDFEPWSAGKSGDLSAKTWSKLRVGVVFGDIIMCKTKAELIELFLSEGDATIEAIDDLQATSRILKAVTQIVDSAVARLIIGGSAAAMKDDGLNPDRGPATPRAKH